MKPTENRIGIISFVSLYITVQIGQLDFNVYLLLYTLQIIMGD